MFEYLRYRLKLLSIEAQLAKAYRLNREAIAEAKKEGANSKSLYDLRQQQHF